MSGLFETSWTVAPQAPPSMGFFRQEHWSGLPFPSPGDLPNPGIETRSPVLQADALTSEPPGKSTILQFKKIETVQANMKGKYREFSSKASAPEPKRPIF